MRLTMTSKKKSISHSTKFEASPLKLAEKVGVAKLKDAGRRA